ncbi:unnamed protein product, partial [Ixodes pacificus]
GSWSINVQAGNSQGSTSFQVEDYGAYFYAHIADNAEWLVGFPLITGFGPQAGFGYPCHRPCDGLPNRFSSCVFFRNSQLLYTFSRLDGCYNYTLNVSLLNTKNFTYPYYPSINITAKVLEKGTGVSERETTLHNRNRERLRLNF